MSDHRNVWGARDDAMWWQGAIAADQQQNIQHHQQMMHQQQQQQQMAAQAQQQQQQQAHEAQSSLPQSHHLFSYKMASSFQHPATTMANVSTPSSICSPGVRTYDYRMSNSAPQQQQQPQQMPAPNQWWYGANPMDNSMHQQQNSLQNMPPVHTPPPVSQQSQVQQAEQVRQEVQRHHQAEAAARQAVAEAQARHQAQQNHQQNHHHQLEQQHQQHNALHHQQQQQLTTVQVLPSRGRMPRGKADARPRGRMTAYAFFVQTCREEHKKKHPEENVVFAEFSKKCAERWKTMLDKEKKRFHEMAEKDKKRYDAEMQNYTPPKGEKQRGKKRKQLKDPNAPKRSLSAFFWFCNDERGKVKGQNPEYGVGDIAKELGRRWAEADHEVKSKYEAMAEKDKARYEKEMTAYKKKNNPSVPAVPVPDPEEEEEDDEEADDDEDE